MKKDKNNTVENLEFKFDQLPAIANTKIINELDLCSLCRFSCVNQFTNKRISKELLELRWRENFTKHFPLVELAFAIDFPNSTWRKEYFKFIVSTFEGDSFFILQIRGKELYNRPLKQKNLKNFQSLQFQNKPLPFFNFFLFNTLYNIKL